MPISDYIHDGDFYDELNTTDVDLAFYRQQCEDAGNPVLEMCCGTGRLTIPLAAAGIEIEGLDITESMIRRAEDKARVQNVDVRWHRGDIRTTRLDRAFSLVFIPFNSLQCLETVDDILAALVNARNHVRTGGRFVFDVFNPDHKFMLDRAAGWHVMKTYDDEAGATVTVSQRCRYDAARQVNAVTWRIDRDGEVREEHLDMRCIYPRELELFLRFAGLRCVQRFGDFDRSPFTSESPRQICVCEIASVQGRESRHHRDQS